MLLKMCGMIMCTNALGLYPSFSRLHWFQRKAVALLSVMDRNQVDLVGSDLFVVLKVRTRPSCLQLAREVNWKARENIYRINKDLRIVSTFNQAELSPLI